MLISNIDSMFIGLKLLTNTYKHCRWIEVGLEMVAFKVVIAGNTVEVVTLGDAKEALRRKEFELKRQKGKLQ